MLPAVDREGHRSGVDAPADVLVPQLLAGLGVEGEEEAVRRAAEHEVAGGRQQARRRPRVHRKLPAHVAGLRFDGAHRPYVVLERLGRLAAAGAVALAFLVLDRPDEVARRGVVGHHVDQAGARAVGGRPPVRAAGDGGGDHGALGRRLHSRHQDGPSVLVESLGPGLPGIGRAEQELAGLAVEHVEERVAVREEHQLALLAAERRVGQHRDLRRIPVVDVVRRELEVPLQLAGVGVEGHHRVGVEVVALPHRAVVVRAGVAGAPVQEVQLRVVGAGHPGRRPAGAPGVAGPGAVVGMVRPRRGVKAPLARAALDVVGVDHAADAVLAPGHAGEDLVSDDERRGRLAVARRRFLHLGLPQDAAGAGVERHQVRVQGAHDHPVALHRHPAVVAAATDDHLVRQRVLVAPPGPAGGRVERDDRAGRFGDVHHAVDHQRRRLGPVEHRELVDPGYLQAADVLPVDPIEAGVAPGLVVARIRQPVVRLVRRVDQALGGDRRERRGFDRRVRRRGLPPAGLRVRRGGGRADRQKGHGRNQATLHHRRSLFMGRQFVERRPPRRGGLHGPILSARGPGPARHPPGACVRLIGNDHSASHG